ncbi:MAG: hypothetical protein IJI54_08645 [Kiritimatiellae bacterium]|nr:hypothetical protein [Kiritimatiellia bacterium]
MKHTTMAAMVTTIAVTAVLSAFADIAMPEVVSHRGESNDRPENSMAAFRLAFERGVDGVECDVYCTSDGVPVIIHDSTTGRTAGSGTNLTVTASTWDELKDVRVGAFSPWIGTDYESETIPKLEDYLALLASNETTRCVIELKGNGANSLVANVVAAVQAQSLATADRVVFIAFDTSLISAVRAALPAYEAWLLLSSGTYTGAGLISQIEACGATGVDINYTSTFTAEDVAAVKAAGYAFAVWTCDSDATALELAQKGVDEITTNRGGAMKTALAALIEEYNTDYNNHLEINDSRFPSGATLMEPSAYVQTSLVAHFDGIRNAGADQPHSTTNRAWKNLVSGKPNAVFSAEDKGYWNSAGTGFFFPGSVAAYLESALDIGTIFTVQLVTDIDLSKQHTKNTTGSAGVKGRYPTYFYANGIDDGFYTDNNNSTTSSNLIFKHNDGSGWVSGTRPSISGWGGKYVTGIVGNGVSYLVQGTELVNGQTCSGNKTIGARQYSWGGFPSNADRSIYGTYHAVRIYTSALTGDDLAWNRVVDEVRFRGVVTNGSVVVASNRAGAEGTEASGTYYVNGNHTFTAPATATIDGCTYELTGYKLETYNASKKAWDFVEVSSAASFAYTNCAANTGARITWNWRLTSGVKKIDADDYVQGGLVLGLDGIRNAGLDVAHNDNATTWKNLGSLGGNATPETFDATLPGAWTAKGYRFDGGDCFVTPTLHLGRQLTVQLVTDYNESLQTATSQWPSPFGTNTGSDNFNIYTYRKYATDRGDLLRFNANAYFGSYSETDLQLWDGRFINALVDYNRLSNTNSATPAWVSRTFKSDIADYSYCIGAAWTAASARKSRSFSGLIHAVRLYDCTLTEAELAHNMEIDNIRFYAGAGRYSGSNLVEVAVESPGGVVSVDEAGSWIIRGEGSSKTFTAPATVTVGNNTYSCTGYRLETWNASKRQWESPVEMAELSSANLSQASENRRLTWLYSLTAGIRSAADYDVQDYVQKGLVANYDGIRNLGPGNGHATAAQRWRDSSYRDVPMIGASNTAHKAWVGFGHHFTATDNSTFRTTEPIDLGYSATFQAVMDALPGSGQTAGRSGDYWPTYFGASENDHGMFTVKTGTELAWKMDNFLYDNKGSYPRAKLQNFGGQYINAIVDGTSANKVYLSQTTVLGTGVNLKKKKEVNGQTWSIGGPNSDDISMITPRTINGDYYAFRIYNRALTEAELAHNMTVDEIRYRGNFTNANVTVVCEVPFEGVEAPVAIPAGDYEVAGSFTFTAGGLTVGESVFPPRYTVETWDGSAWGEAVEYDGSSYTYTAGAKVRLTWKWADPTIPVTATWTGEGEAGNLLDPANWSCVNAAGETIVAAPTNVTTVTISGTTSFTIPDGVTSFPWKEIKFGASDAHVATRCGSIKLNSAADIGDLPTGMFNVLSSAQTSLANLNEGNTSWQTSYLKTSRVRYDGWFYVTAAQAGTWTVTQMFDNYFGFAIDGEWIIVNPTYVNSMTTTVDVPEGWHRFTIVCGDTSGGYGSTETSSVVVNGVHAPMSISWGGAAVTFTDGNFTFGGDGNTVVLSDDCDWRALGNVFIANGAVIDLNGHNLEAPSLVSDYLGAMITNSNDEVQSIMTFTASEGTAITNGVAICGNVKVVKKGSGKYCAYATGCTYSGGTFIDEGTAQPPDGSGTDTQYCYDQFKAFGTNEIYVASGATFDLRANYAYRSWIVLGGGSLVNTKANMTTTGNGGSGIGRLTADSYLGVTNSIVFGDNSSTSGNLDLDGHTLTAWIKASTYLYLRCSSITNGVIDITNGGWLQVVNACDARTVDFKMCCALYMAAAMSVHDYEPSFAGSNSNNGTAVLSVYGTFRPLSSKNYFYGCTMQDGSAIDLSGQTGSFSTTSAFTKGSNYLKFAADANVTVNLAGRAGLPALAHERGLIMTWTEDTAPAASVTFQVDAETRRAGFKVVRDDEHNALRLARASGFRIIVK